ncbi:MAG: LysR family transcriptional regulator [Methylobacteriaceae bacterium]|nr:LysR family transcriptional regulator [Methylobacteriaceae bacterium]
MNSIDIRRLDFGLLRVFLELARHRKTTLAAERLGLTQSSISHALARLRDALGDPLFVRRPTGLAPTERALALEPAIREIVARTEALLAPAEPFDPARAEGTLRIGAFDYDCALLAHDVIAAVDARAPALTTSFRPLVRRRAHEALLADELDVAIGYFWGRTAGIETTPLFEEGYAVILRGGHPLAGSPDLALADYVGARHVLVSYEGDAVGIVDQVLQRQGLSREVAATVPFFFPALSVVGRSDLLATVPRRLAGRHAASFGLVTREPPVAIRSFTVSAAWSPRGRAAALRDWCVALLREITRGEEGPATGRSDENGPPQRAVIRAKG